MRPISAFRIFLPAAGLLLATTGRSQPAPSPTPPVTVESIVDDILSHNPEVAFYEAEIDAARATSSAAATRDNPELSVEFGRKRVTDATGTLAGEGSAWSVSVSQVFEWPGRIALRKAIANRDVELAQLGLERFKAALANRARVLAHGLHAARARADATAEVAERYRALRQLFLARDPAGITPLLETRVIEAEELTLQARAADAALALKSALVELNLLRGIAPGTPVEVVPGDPKFGPAPSIDDALASARENNFEFRAAKIELEQQGLVVSLARNERRPSVTVSPFFSEEKALDRERTFGLGFSLPVPVSRRAGANVEAAEARRRQAETALLVAQRNMEREVIGAVNRLSARLAGSAVWVPDAADKFREAAELADRHFRLGAVPIGTYVELQNSYLEAVDSIHAIQLEALEAAGDLQVLTGGATISTGNTTP